MLQRSKHGGKMRNRTIRSFIPKRTVINLEVSSQAGTNRQKTEMSREMILVVVKVQIPDLFPSSQLSRRWSQAKEEENQGKEDSIEAGREALASTFTSLSCSPLTTSPSSLSFPPALSCPLLPSPSVFFRLPCSPSLLPAPVSSRTAHPDTGSQKNIRKDH
eukprot:241973-Hanusia_phi.AAC.1